MRFLFSLIVFAGLLLPVLSEAQESTIKRDSFSLKYPSDWKIDTEDPDYDPDALFSLNSPDGNNMIMFIISTTPIDEQVMLDAQVEEFSKSLIKKPVITDFTQWGKYKGTGKVLKGKISGVLKGFVRIFVYTDEYKTLLVVSQGYDEDLGTLQKGYDLIESSFSFH